MTNLDINKAYVGDTQVEKIYLGADVVWGGSEPEPEPIYSAMPLTFNIISAGTIIWKAQNTAYTTTIEYSLDNGETWTSITSNTGDSAPSISVNAGDVVQFRGDNATYATETSQYNCFSGSTAIFEAEGNIMSLIYSTGFETATTLTDRYVFLNLFSTCAGLTSAENLVLPATTLAEYCYQYMFYGCTGLTQAPELPATTLAQSCYYGMFSGCTNLMSAPELPATTLAQSCYYCMFYNCTSLTSAPELPATTLAPGCYNQMFQGCTSLITAPELPATTLANVCYQMMFYGCTGLTSAPELPATTLADGCCNYMFAGCTSLASAPELPATTLATYCYSNMFLGCTSLTSITCLATDISATECTSDWVNGVASRGTFVGYPGTYWTVGSNGIPQGWTFTQYYVVPTAMTIVVAAAITNSGQAKVSFEPIYGWSDSVSWTSSDTSLAQIDENGNITVAADGNITISATDNNYGLSATANVEVRKRTIDTRVVATYEGGTKEILCNTDGFSKVEKENGHEINLDRFYFDAPEEDYKLYFTLSDDTLLPYDCFYHMDGLLSLEIPASVQTIGDYAFCRCTQLSSITCYAETAPSYPGPGPEYLGGTFYYPAASIDSYQMMIGEFQMSDWTCTGI